MADGIFVTGAGTEIGKTLVACALIHQLKGRGVPVRPLKPVITGFESGTAAESDSGLLLAAAGETVTEAAVAACSPWRFAEPIAPSMAARRAGRPFALGDVIRHCRDALDGPVFTVIEGVGGVMAPVTDDALVLDWMTALALPAVLVSGSYLGAISHTLSAARVIADTGVPLAGIVVSESAEQPVPLPETVDAVESFLPGVPVRAVPRLTPGAAIWERAPDLTSVLPGITAA